MTDIPKTKVLVPGGHEFKIDEDGELDYMDADYHSYVWCVLCLDGECTMCNPDILKDACPEKAFATLPGLEYD